MADLGALVAGATVAVSDARSLSAEECAQREAKDYASLERAAVETLDGLGNRSQHASRCEDQGRPGASVVVSVYDWNRSADAHSFLRNEGLPQVGGSSISSTRHGLLVAYPLVRDYQENDGRRFVAVRFTLAG